MLAYLRVHCAALGEGQVHACMLAYLRVHYAALGEGQACACY